jgi:hypothetical protein
VLAIEASRLARNGRDWHMFDRVLWTAWRDPRRRGRTLRSSSSFADGMIE